MDIKVFRQYIANKSSKKIITESLEYKVERVTVIPKEEQHTGIAGTKKTITFPNAGKTAVLLRFKDGKITTGVGKNKEEAIDDAVRSKVTLFGESVDNLKEELTIVKNHDGGYLAFDGNPVKNAPVVAFVSKTGEIMTMNKQGAPTVVKTVSGATLKNPAELKKVIATLTEQTSKGDLKAAIIGLPRLKNLAKMAKQVEDVIKTVTDMPTSVPGKKMRLLGNLRELHSMLSSSRIDPSEIDILQNEIIRDINLV